MSTPASGENHNRLAAVGACNVCDRYFCSTRLNHVLRSECRGEQVAYGQVREGNTHHAQKSWMLGRVLLPSNKQICRVGSGARL